VPAWSQTLDGRAAGIVLGDHLDVIGHSEAAGATFLRSGSHFDEARFRELWDQIGRALGTVSGTPYGT
jgi:triacylglycerol lipase